MKYPKLNNIVKYYEKNEERVLSRYQSMVYDHITRECEYVSDDKVPPYVWTIIFEYSFDTYFKSHVKKGNGQYPTEELLTWVKGNYRKLEAQFVSEHSLNYSPIDLLKFILSKY